MYCPNCGTFLPDDALYCSSCGTRVDAPDAPDAPDAAKPSGPAGYSTMIDSPEVRAALEKVRKSGRVWIAVSCILPLLVALGAGVFSDKVELKDALVVGLVISLIFFVINLFNSIKQRSGKPWEGTMVDKEVVRSGRRGNERMVKVLHIRTTQGKKKKIEDSVLGTAYEYFSIGDELRFVPGFPFPYEKKDKSGDDYVICMFCSRKADISADRCPHCHRPLIK